MFTKIIKSTFLLINILILISPFVLIAYNIYIFVQTGNITIIPLLNAAYDWFGFDLTISNIPSGLEGVYEIYLLLVRLPLLLWLFILSIPSFIKIYRQI